MNQKKMDIWQERLALADADTDDERQRMKAREALYKGDNLLLPLTAQEKQARRCVNAKTERTSHVRNICFEHIETQIDSSVPACKVIPIHQRDEGLALKIEHWIANEMERLNSEELNDLAERTVPIQGGCEWLTDWDETQGRSGQLVRRMIHPRQMRPQPGVYTDTEDMDWNIINIPSTKQAVWNKYHIDLSNQTESDPEDRDIENAEYQENAVTVHMGYERDQDGGINLYIWCNDIELADLENYQARKQPVCRACGRVRPTRGQIVPHLEELQEDPEVQAAKDRLLGQQLADRIAGEYLSGMPAGGTVADAADPEPETYDGGPCPYCGGTEFETREMEFEEIVLPIQREGMEPIPGLHPEVREDGAVEEVPTKIPFYKPNLYPLVIQKNVSVYGQLLGNSDIDMIADQQNSINRMEQKILNRLMDAGTVITKPENRPDLRVDGKDGNQWPVNQTEKNLIGVYDLSGNIQYELTMLGQYYEESRQALGITDSFQGRHDPTATSGKAKEFAASRAAGRMESKRTMKNAAYARNFELMFKFWLAFGDEPQEVRYRDHNGNIQYEVISRYDFLRKTPEGLWEWNDEFLFTTDNTAALAQNREAMWQETRMNFQTGAFGNPASPQAQVLFWTVMESLHYPKAKEIKENLEEQLQQMQAVQAAMPPPPPAGAPTPGTQTMI